MMTVTPDPLLSVGELIACPRPLGLATSLSVMVSTGKRADHGILIRSAEAQETSQEIDTIVFDRTGTITRGEPALTDVVTTGTIRRDEVLRLVASAERSSGHPLTHAIAAPACRLDLVDATEFDSVIGKGVRAFVDGREVLIGSQCALDDAHIDTARITSADPAHDCASTFDFDGRRET